MSNLDQHPILGQLNAMERRLTSVSELQTALAERRRIMERDGKVTTVVAGFIGMSGLFFMKPLSFYLVLALLVIGLPLVWRHLLKEARDFQMSDADIQEVLDSDRSETAS